MDLNSQRLLAVGYVAVAVLMLAFFGVMIAGYWELPSIALMGFFVYLGAGFLAIYSIGLRKKRHWLHRRGRTLYH